MPSQKQAGSWSAQKQDLISQHDCLIEFITPGLRDVKLVGIRDKQSNITYAVKTVYTPAETLVSYLDSEMPPGLLINCS